MAKRTAKRAKIYIGSSSWVERNLIASGRYYPPEAKDTDARLSFYARDFNLAEIDSTYYAFTSSKNTERWASAVPDAFRFNVKAFALFTQHPARTNSIPKSFREALPPDAAKKARVYYKDVPREISDEMWSVFLRTLGPLRTAGKLGAILVDFPPWYVPNEANRSYIAQARERIPDDNVIIEFRNHLWVADDETRESTIGLLRSLECGFVCVDEPPGTKSSFPPIAVATAAVGAVRFRGRNADRWEDKDASMEDRLDWSYSDDELREWLPRIEQIAAETDEVYLTMNTKKADQGVANAAKLKRLLGL